MAPPVSGRAARRCAHHVDDPGGRGVNAQYTQGLIAKRAEDVRRAGGQGDHVAGPQSGGRGLVPLQKGFHCAFQHEQAFYDGRIEATGDLAATVKRLDAEQAEFRAKLKLPGDPAVLGNLATRYRNADLGTLDVSRTAAVTVLRSATFATPLGTKRNEDGTDSVIATDALLLGSDWVVGNEGGRRTLTMRDGQHTYVFTEVAG